jgi:hypothetical protein
MNKQNERRCKICGVRKDLSEFAPDAWESHNKNADVWVRACLVCRGEIDVVRIPAGVESKKLAQKGRHLERTYGISLKEYEVLYGQQKGLCAICHRPEPTNNGRLFLAVDHDHETGHIRGLLCSKCNVALGLFEDNVKSLAEATRYINKSRRKYKNNPLD